MSVVTNVIVTFSVSELRSIEAETSDSDPIIVAINRFFGEYKGFCNVDPIAGGTKRLECVVLVAALNYLDLDALLEHLRGLPWKHPEWVQVFAQKQEEDVFTEYRP